MAGSIFVHLKSAILLVTLTLNRVDGGQIQLFGAGASFPGEVLLQWLASYVYSRQETGDWNGRQFGLQDVEQRVRETCGCSRSRTGTSTE